MVYRLIIGRRNTNEDGMWVSKPGYNVFTAGDGQLSFNSDWNTFKFAERGTYTISTLTYNSFFNWYTGNIPFSGSYSAGPIIFLAIVPASTSEKYCSNVPNIITYGIANANGTALLTVSGFNTTSLGILVTGSMSAGNLGSAFTNYVIHYTIWENASP